MRYVWGFLFARFGERRFFFVSRITRGQGTWHKTQSARRIRRSASTCDTTFSGGAIFKGEAVVAHHVESEERREDFLKRPLKNTAFSDHRDFLTNLRRVFFETAGLKNV